MDVKGYHIKQNKPGSEEQRCYVFPHMWKLDLKYKCIHKYIYDLVHTYTQIHTHKYREMTFL
jgi:hypothetical protein